MSYLLNVPGFWAMAAPLLELGLAISLVVATRDASLKIITVWITLYLPINLFIWILPCFDLDHFAGIVDLSLEDDTKNLLLQFYPLLLLLLSLVYIWVAETGYEFLLLRWKKQLREEMKDKMKERREWRIRNMVSSKKVDKQPTQTTIHCWADDKGLDDSEKKV